MPTINKISLKSIIYDLAADASNVSYDASTSTRDKIAAAINSQNGSHGMRYYQNQLQIYNTSTSEQETISTGGSEGIPIGAATGASASTFKSTAILLLSRPEREGDI